MTFPTHVCLKRLRPEFSTHYYAEQWWEQTGDDRGISVSGVRSGGVPLPRMSVAVAEYRGKYTRPPSGPTNK